MVQNTLRLDDCEEEESEVTREVRAERGGEKREGDAPQGSRVTNEERV